MRQLTTLPPDQARLLADYLLTLGIHTHLDAEPEGLAVWIRDEDQLPKAQQEFAAFQTNPTAPQYTQARTRASAIRSREEQKEEEYHRRQESFRDRMADANGPTRLGPLTLGLILACILVAALTSLGNNQQSPVYRALLIAPVVVDDGFVQWDSLNAITRRYEIWRLITPIFLHFGVLHLLFNLLMLANIGSSVERRLGPLRYLGLVLFIAVVSNLAEYFLKLGFNVEGFIQFSRSPLFGGMSGVLYGLFGYLWMLARASEDPERVLPSQFVNTLLIWLVVCMTGVLGPIANTAHLVGLLVGAGVGVLAVRFRR